VVYTRLLRMRHRWRIAAVDWFALRDLAAADRHCAFCQGAGLFNVDDRPKPVWHALRRIVRRFGASR
jgi:hypothetical protein